MTPLLPQFIDVMQRGLVVLEKGTPEVIDSPLTISSMPPS
jgi:hypothetical protein